MKIPHWHQILIFMIYALLLRNFDVRIYALFPQIFGNWKVYSADFFTFRMYAPNITKLYHQIFRSPLDTVLPVEISPTPTWRDDNISSGPSLRNSLMSLQRNLQRSLQRTLQKNLQKSLQKNLQKSLQRKAQKSPRKRRPWDCFPIMVTMGICLLPLLSLCPLSTKVVPTYTTDTIHTVVVVPTATL